jgi:adenylate cyclase
VSAAEPGRLWAILAADAAGYSRLMAGNERATMAALDAGRVAFRRQTEANQGRVIDTAGDSVLAVFQTAAGAISAALAVQQELLAESSSEPEERRMRFRIGLHLGDVIEKSDGTVYGDGVNIAARLQAKAPPGGICISQTVYDTVKGKIPMRATFAGPQTFKNIAEPIPIWQITPEGAVPALPVASRRRTVRWIAGSAVAIAFLAIAASWYATRPEAPVKPPAGKADISSMSPNSLAVLPFTNMSEDKSTAYFADGVHEDLLTQLALLGDLKVVSRTSVMEYRDSKKNMRQIGAELGVGSLVEGSVRRAGNQVRVTAQLVDVRTDKHLWAKSYDRELKDIFAIQSELATEIARALRISLAPQEQTRLARRPTDNLEAYDFFLRHQDLVNQSTGTVRIMSTVKERVALLSRAVELDPKFALAWARLAAEHARAHGYGIDRDPGRKKQARDAMDRALALSPADVQIEIEAGTYYRLALNDYARAAGSFENALKAAPHNVEALIGLSEVYMDQFRIADCVALLERAFAVDSRNSGVLIRLANHYRNHRHYERSLALRQLLINLRPDDLDLQASYHNVEYWRSGSWDSYDRWRSTIPKAAGMKSARVMFTDIDRAIARRDFPEVLRLIEVDSEDVTSLRDSSSAAERSVNRAVALRAKGDRVQAGNAAREALRLIEAELRKSPRNDSMWAAKARMHALLGERKAALLAHARAVAQSEENSGKRSADFTYRGILDVHALLGDGVEALAELARQLRLPSSLPHEFRVHLELASLWDDSQFQALVNDPKNNAPLPIVNRDPPWLGK